MQTIMSKRKKSMVHCDEEVFNKVEVATREILMLLMTRVKSIRK